MSDDERPQLYLITPPVLGETFEAQLGRVLDAAPVACLRLALASTDEDVLARAADAVRQIAHARDVPVVVDRHGGLVERLGLDGVHLTDGARSVRHWRGALGADAIVGAACGSSRHDGINAGEAGADYVAFGPVRATALGDGSVAGRDLFAWWSEMIEIPVVAEGAFDLEMAADLGGVADFIALGAEIWDGGDPAARLKAFANVLG
jgi:thiamine-phosphate pyrophosphorylase